MNPPAEPPHGYKFIQGRAQKGDGVWDAEKGRFRKVSKQYPTTEAAIIIRKCEVTQVPLRVGAVEEEV